MPPSFREQCPVQSLSASFDLPILTDVLRLDKVHPVVSGNKWFKLKHYIAAAKEEGKTTLLTFGGAYSNHIVATAAAAQQSGLKSIGLIRGEAPAQLSHTLQNAKAFGMSLCFLSREDYSLKIIPPSVFNNGIAENIYTIPEGGYGPQGVQGGAEILKLNDAAPYTHIVVAVGTGTTLAALVASALPHQTIVGIPVLKNAFSLQPEIEALLPKEQHHQFLLQWDYHFGGYAKHTTNLLNFMNDVYRHSGVETDFVYTGKAFFAAFDLVRKNYFPARSKLLLVHTGGLQGNASLKKGTLIYGAG